jgi:site-specific DNA recombinase
MEMNKNSTVILARVSSKSQEDEGYSLDSQLKLLRGYCQANSLDVVKVYNIAETASKDQSRKIFGELLTYLKENSIYNLAVEKTDRLTRNLKDAVAIDDWLNDDADRMLHAVKESLKVHKEARSDVKFMWNIHLAVAKKYTDNLREEAMKGWAEKLAQGHMPSRPPIGYMTAIQHGKKVHVPDPKKAPFITQAFELYLEADGSIDSIWTFLGKAGITSYTGRPLFKSAVHILLKNKYYMGIIEFNGETYVGAHEPFITKQLYQQVQYKMHRGKPALRTNHDVSLKNIMRCGHCGKIVTWEKHKGTYYGACQRDLPECRQNKYLREDTALEILVEKMGNLICPTQKVIEWLVGRLENDYVERVTHIDNLRYNIKSRITRLEKMDEVLYDDKLSGEITKERYETKHLEILKQIEELSDQLEVNQLNDPTVHNQAVSLVKLTQSAKEEFLSEDLTKTQKRTILTELFDSVVYESGTVSVNYKPFVNSIAERSQKSNQILKENNMLNRTTKKDLNSGGQSVDKFQLDLLRPAWQGHVESNHDPRFWRPMY